MNEVNPHAVFLDRDGVINFDSPNYIKNWNEFRFIPGSLEAIAQLTRHRFPVIVVTNQSAIHRGLTSSAEVLDIHRRLREAVTSHGGRIQDIFYCPHTPDERCDCRKPEPGMIFSAQKKYNIDVDRSWMVGDSARDIECGVNAGCGHTILVQTGDFDTATILFEQKKVRPEYTAKDLAEAANIIVNFSK